jgi:hypothetical protein
MFFTVDIFYSSAAIPVKRSMLLFQLFQFVPKKASSLVLAGNVPTKPSTKNSPCLARCNLALAVCNDFEMMEGELALLASALVFVLEPINEDAPCHSFHLPLIRE